MIIMVVMLIIEIFGSFGNDVKNVLWMIVVGMGGVVLLLIGGYVVFKVCCSRLVDMIIY